MGAAGAYEFTSTLWAQVGDPAAWFFVSLPGELADCVSDDAGPRPAFGSVRVTATVGATTWSTSLFPDKAHARYVLPVKKAVRIAEGIEAGDQVRVSIALVDSPTGP